MKQRNNWKEAVKHATSLFAENKEKPYSDTSRLSAAKIAIKVNEQYGTFITVRYIQQCVQDNKIGISPATKGPKGGLTKQVNKHLGEALLSFIRIQQINGESQYCGRSTLINRVNTAA